MAITSRSSSRSRATFRIQSQGPADQADRDRQAFALAKKFLLSLNGVTPNSVDRHLNSYEVTRPRTMKRIYWRMLFSATNKSMAPNVIRKPTRDLRALRPVLGGFDPRYVAAKYGEDWQQVLNDIARGGTTRARPAIPQKGLWAQFGRTVTSGAAFLAQFESPRDFRRWVRLFDKDERTRPALPMLLSHEIQGFGFPLACDFLKEIGYPNFGKPDVHLKKIFAALELSPTESDYDVFKAITRVATNAGVTPYAVDKLFWLIGSGNLHLDGMMIGRHRAEFIAHASKRLRGRRRAASRRRR